MFRGKLFHSVGAAAAKDLLPKYSNRHLGGVSRWFSADRRVRFGEYGISSSRIYAGASPFKALYVSKRILKSILCFTGSQCRSTRTGVMWSYLRHLVMTRAAWFWRFYCLSIKKSYQNRESLYLQRLSLNWNGALCIRGIIGNVLQQCPNLK